MKKFLSISMVVCLLSSLCGCGVGKEVEIGSVEQSKAEFVVSETLEMENVRYPLFEGWSLFKDVNGTLCYINEDSTQTISLFVQKETSHTPEEMYEVYEKTITSTFDTEGSSESVMLGMRNWRKYLSTQETVNGLVSTHCYLFSTGDTTVYVEISSKEGASEVDDAFMSALEIDVSKDKDWKSSSDEAFETIVLGGYEFSKPVTWVLDSEDVDQVSYKSQTGYEVYAFQLQTGLGGATLETIKEAMKTSCESTIGTVKRESTWDSDACSWIVYDYEQILEGYDVYTYMYTDGSDMILICATVPSGEGLEDFEKCLNSMRVIK